MRNTFDRAGVMRTRSVVLAAGGLAASYVLLAVVLSATRTPSFLQTFLVAGSVAAVGVAWYLAWTGLGLATILLALYLARVLAAIPVALILGSPVLAQLATSASLGAYDASSGLNSTSVVFTLTWLVVIAAVGTALGRLSNKRIERTPQG